MAAIEYEVRLRSTKGHPKQELMISSKYKRKIIRAGRRSGKTTGIARLAVEALLAGKRVLYATPTADQIQKFWFEVIRALEELITHDIYKKNETNHSIELVGTTARIRAKTAYNADGLRGDYADVLILDEWQMMDESAWEEVGAPMLADNNGDAIFIYTPPSLTSRSVTKARDVMHAAKMYIKAQEEMALAEKETECKSCQKTYKLAELAQAEEGKPILVCPNCSATMPATRDSRWLALHFTSYDNPHVSAEGLLEVSKDMTALARRQELLAEDIKEMPGSLWKLAMIEKYRVTKEEFERRGGLKQLTRIVVGVDPSGSSTTEAGIVACGIDAKGHGYVLKDATMLAPSPKNWATTAVNTYTDYKADRILGERNYGGDMVRETIMTVNNNVSYKDVIATRGKIVRAEPVCAKYENGLVHHVGDFPLLEDEMCSYVPGNDSPNRMDALVWAFTELLPEFGTLGLIEYFSSGKAQADMISGEAQVRAAMQGKIKIVEDETPAANSDAPKEESKGCTNCGSLMPLIDIGGGGGMRCQQCGYQSNKAPFAPKSMNRTGWFANR